jgi:polyisoprenoid-binding protein YceI
MSSHVSSKASLDLEALLRDGQGRWTLDPEGSDVEFHVRHFWGAITVHGHFERVEGEGTLDEDGNVSGQLRIETASLTTRNRKRDEHLRSTEFFDAEHHPSVVVTVRHLAPEGHVLRGEITLEAAGRRQVLAPTVEVIEATSGSVSLRSEVVVDRTTFGMTWSPLKMASYQALAVVTARFVRS